MGSHDHDTFLGQPHGGRSFCRNYLNYSSEGPIQFLGHVDNTFGFGCFREINNYVYRSATQPDWPYHLPFWVLTSSNRTLNFPRYYFGSKTGGRATLTRK